MKKIIHYLPANLLMTSLLILLMLSATVRVSAQFPATPEGRLGLLCKTWGLLKYHHTEVKRGHVNWDSVLVANVLPVKNAVMLTAFNVAMNNVIDAAGIMQSTISASVPNMPVNVDFSWINDPMFDATVQAKLAFVRDNFVADTNAYVTVDPTFSTFPFLDFVNETFVVPNPSFPAAEYRFLLMFRYWNIVNYYFPYRHLMDVLWDQSLVDMVPSFDTASTALSYHLAFARLCAKINDTHAAYVKSTELYHHWQFDQTTIPPIYLRYLNNQTVVAHLFMNIPGLSEGDIIHKINGMDIDSLRTEYRQYFSHSNDASGNRDALMDMLQTYGIPSMQLTVEDSSGNINTISTSTQMNYAAFSDSINACPWCGPPYVLTTCGYGYVNMGLLQPADVPNMVADLQNAPAIIFDMRSYPNLTAWDIATAMFSNNATFSRYHIPIAEFPGDYSLYMDNIGNNGNPNGYTGKIYILVNEVTQSQAEYSTMMLSKMPNATVKIIGSTTAGADGDITEFYFPGNIRFRFSGGGVYNPDSSNTQRVGILPDTVVVPTAAGIRHHEDEVLRAALDCLTGINSVQKNENQIKIFPNPGKGTFTIQFDNASDQKVKISILDITGRNVFATEYITTGEYFNRLLNLDNLSAGAYVVRVETGKRIRSEKIFIQ